MSWNASEWCIKMAVWVSTVHTCITEAMCNVCREFVHGPGWRWHHHHSWVQTAWGSDATLPCQKEAAQVVWSSPSGRRPPAVEPAWECLRTPREELVNWGKGWNILFSLLPYTPMLDRQIMDGWMDGWTAHPAYCQLLYYHIEAFRLLHVLAFQYEVFVFFFLQTLSEKKLQAVVNPIDQSVVSALFWF